MKILKVTSDGRVTIPAELRKKYNLLPGTRVNLFEEDDGIKIVPQMNESITSENIKTNKGFLRTKGKLLKYLMEEKKIEHEL
jgi:AbrB family looped-hinge helix DNA binding protein